MTVTAVAKHIFCNLHTVNQGHYARQEVGQNNGDTKVKMLITVTITAIIVSLDSFVAGFSLSLNKKANLILPSAVTLITLAMCLATSLVGALLEKYLGKNIDYMGAALLLLLATLNLVRKDEATMSLQTVTLAESMTIGVAVGMDAAVANLSLSISGVGLVAPLVFAVTHFITVLLGQLLARKVQLEHTNVLAAVILFVLAITKLI